MTRSIVLLVVFPSGITANNLLSDAARRLSRTSFHYDGETTATDGRPAFRVTTTVAGAATNASVCAQLQRQIGDAASVVIP